MADKSSGPKPIKIADVAKPGKSAPSASSKPILITHHPLLKDPMMVDQDAPKSEDHTLPSGRLKISPITMTADDIPTTVIPNRHAAPVDPEESETTPGATVTSTEPAALDESTDAAQPTLDSSGEQASETTPEPAPVGAATDEENPAAASDQSTTPATDDADSNDETPAKPATDASRKADADHAAAEEKRLAELTELAASRKFYLPINQIEKRKAREYAWAGILLILLLAVAWGDIALDAHLITIPGVKPVTHFFSN